MSTLAKTSEFRAMRPLLLASLVFLLVSAAATTFIWNLQQRLLQEERTRVAALAGDHANALQRNIEHVLSATYALAAMVRQGQGDFPNFAEVAQQMLPLYPGADSLQLAPGGVTRQIVPLAGNEKGVGRELLIDPLRNKEALLARDSGKLTLAGPFELIQGGMGAIGRFPVFLDDASDNKLFWGFTSVVMRFPDLLDSVRLPRLAEDNFAYELWRIHPDTGEKQTITSSSSPLSTPPVNQILNLPNGIWTLSVAPVKGWGNPVERSLMGVFGLLFSLLLAWLTKLLVESKNYKAGLEELVSTRTTEIKEAKEHLRLLEDNLPDSYIYQYLREADKTPQLLYLSAGVEQLHGINREEVLQDAATLFRQIDPEQIPAVLTADAASTKNLTDFQMELRMRRADGQWRWLEVHSRPRINVDGPIMWDGVVSDITALKQVEAELRHSEARYRELFVVNPHPMWVYDLDTLAFLAVNDAAVSHYGYSREDFLAMTIREIHSPEEVPRLLANVSSVSTGVDKAGRWWHCKKDGSLILVEITSHTLVFAGRPAELVVAYDITKRHLVEEKIRMLNAELEQRVAERTREFEAKNAELERLNHLFVGRELRMRELKQQIAAMEQLTSSGGQT